jgi:hypothetical protein
MKASEGGFFSGFSGQKKSPLLEFPILLKFQNNVIDAMIFFERNV